MSLNIAPLAGIDSEFLVNRIGTSFRAGFLAASIFRTTGTMFRYTASEPEFSAIPSSTSYGCNTI